MIPQTTSPLTKSIRTLEGWLVIAANVALVVIPIVTNSLPPELAAKLVAGLDAIYALSRGIVKAFGTSAAPAASVAAEPIPDGHTSPEVAAEWRQRRYPGS